MRNSIILAFGAVALLLLHASLAQAQTVVRLQQVRTDQYLDAYLTSENDYQVVTRQRQGDDSQQWLMTQIQGDIYTFQQLINDRFLDAYQDTRPGEGTLNDYNVVTRNEQGDHTQQWLVAQLPAGHYTIQQVSTGRYLWATSLDGFDFWARTHDGETDEQYRDGLWWRIIPVRTIDPAQRIPQGPLVDVPGRVPEPGATITAEGAAELSNGDIVDLDFTTRDSDPDIMLDWLAIGGGELALVNGARYKSVAPEPQGPEGCASGARSSAPIPISDLSEGDYICVETNEGRYSEMRIDRIRPLLRSVEISFTTWEF